MTETKVELSSLDGKKAYLAVGPGRLFLEPSGRVLLNGIALIPKDRGSLLQDVAVSDPPGSQLAGVMMRGLEVKPDVEKRSSIHEVDGYAYLGEDTTPKAARAEALATAKRQALEMAKVYLKSNSLIKDGALQYDFIKSDAQGFVTVLEQKDHGITNNRYHVWIRAEVKYDLRPFETNSETVQKVFSHGPLTVKIWTTKKHYRNGERVTVHMVGNRDFYALILNVDSENSITQLLPNDYRRRHHFVGGRHYTIPGEEDRFAIEVATANGYGEEKIVVYASESPLGKVPTQSVGRGLRRFDGTEEQIARSTRAIAVRPKGNPSGSGEGFYEAIWKFTTAP